MKRGLKVLIIILVILVVVAIAILLVKHFTTNEVSNELTGNSISYDNADAITSSFPNNKMFLKISFNACKNWIIKLLNEE